MPCGRRLCGLPALPSATLPTPDQLAPSAAGACLRRCTGLPRLEQLDPPGSRPLYRPCQGNPLPRQLRATTPSGSNHRSARRISIAISIAISRHLPLSRLAQACTEIRAASLSGDCTWNREARATPPRRAAPLPPAPRRATSMRCMRRHVMDAVHAVHGVHDMHGRRAQINRGNVFLAVSGAGARCIRRRAELSVSMNPACPSASAAARAVEDAWGHCFKDRAPFPQALENPPGFS